MDVIEPIANPPAHFTRGDVDCSDAPVTTISEKKQAVHIIKRRAAEVLLKACICRGEACNAFPVRPQDVCDAVDGHANESLGRDARRAVFPNGATEVNGLRGD